MIFTEIPEKDLLEYQKSVSDDVDLLPIYHSIDSELKHIFPLANAYFYKAIIDIQTIHIIVRVNRFVCPIVIFSCSKNLSLTDEQYIQVFKAFADTAKIISLDDDIQIRAPDFLLNVFNTWRAQNYKNAPTRNVPVYLCYMNKEQIELAKNFQFNLPDGYSFCDEITPSDALSINSKWKNAREGDDKQTAAKLTHMPFGCIKFKDVPVSWIVNDPAGTLTQLFTEPDHRRQGLGLAVEMKACKNIISINRVPFKLIEQTNTAFFDSANNRKYWSCYNYDNGDHIDLYITVPLSRYN
uniref:Glycine N-acyltransferase-like protein n=1 Tax=Rhabditophanes sp. KR3021 TaxID=114890 RepID=A0AC35TG82_9BILA